MKTISEYLQNKLKPINFENLLHIDKVKLNEADDPIGDIGDMGGDPLGGSDPMAGGDPMGDMGGGAPMGDAPMDDIPMDDDSGFENDKTDTLEDEDAEEDTHEDDPDWTKGVQDADNVMLPDQPAGETIYDAESLFKSIAAVKSTENTDLLASIEEVENALSLIGNGKKLKIEDVTFTDPENAIELINKIEEPLDIKLKNYIDLKIKQPIILQRDKNKAELAKLAKANDTARSTLDAMN